MFNFSLLTVILARIPTPSFVVLCPSLPARELLLLLELDVHPAADPVLVEPRSRPVERTGDPVLLTNNGALVAFETRPWPAVPAFVLWWGLVAVLFPAAVTVVPADPASAVVLSMVTVLVMVPVVVAGEGGEGGAMSYSPRATSRASTQWICCRNSPSCTPVPLQYCWRGRRWRQCTPPRGWRSICHCISPWRVPWLPCVCPLPHPRQAGTPSPPQSTTMCGPTRTPTLHGYCGGRR